MAQKEIYSGDVATKQKPDIDLSLDNDLTIVRRNEDIVSDVENVNKSYLDNLAFAEEEMTIILEQSSDRFAPTIVDVSVNGITEYIPVGRPYRIKRKYVEVLARCKSDNIATTQKESQDGDTTNHVTRFTSKKYPFSVMHDPNPKGYDWLVQQLSAA